MDAAIGSSKLDPRHTKHYKRYETHTKRCKAWRKTEIRYDGGCVETPRYLYSIVNIIHRTTGLLYDMLQFKALQCVLSRLVCTMSIVFESLSMIESCYLSTLHCIIFFVIPCPYHPTHGQLNSCIPDAIENWRGLLTHADAQQGVVLNFLSAKVGNFSACSVCVALS